MKKLLFSTSLVFLSFLAYSQSNKHFQGVLDYEVKHSGEKSKTAYPNQLKMYLTEGKLRIDAKTYFGYVIYIYNAVEKTGVRLYEIYGDKYLAKINFEKEAYKPEAIVEIDKKKDRLILDYRCMLATISQPGTTYKGWFAADIHTSDNIKELAPYVPYGIIQPHTKTGNRLFFDLTIEHQAEGTKQFVLQELKAEKPTDNFFEFNEKDYEVVSLQKIQETLSSLSDWKQY